MKMFISERCSKAVNDAPGRLHLTHCQHYIEVEVTATPEMSYFGYIIPRKGGEYYIAAILPDRINEISAFDKMPLETLEQRTNMPKFHPHAYRLLMNGRDDHYRNGALIILDDPDEKRKRLAIVVVWGNVDTAQAMAEIKQRMSTAIEQANFVIDEYGAIFEHPWKHSGAVLGAKALQLGAEVTEKVAKMALRDLTGAVSDIITGGETDE